MVNYPTGHGNRNETYGVLTKWLYRKTQTLSSGNVQDVRTPGKNATNNVNARSSNDSKVKSKNTQNESR